MDFSGTVTLGRSGLEVGRLGISSSYRAPAGAYEEALDHGCNYWTWGTFIKGTSSEMAAAVRNVIARGERDRLVLGMWSYSHSPMLMEPLLRRSLRQLGTEYVDVLLLGYHPKRPSRRVLETALRLKELGLARHLGLSSHNRSAFAPISKEGIIDVFHVRYNAVHRGAESDVFPHMQGDGSPGIVSFTATCWGRLLQQKRMPPGEIAPTAADCYRFVLSQPAVDVSMMGARTIEQMRENLDVLSQGPMSEEELERMRRIGDFLYGKDR